MDVREILLWLSVGVFLLVALVMLVLAWRHHQAPGKDGENFHASVGVELGWTVIPLLMVVALAWPAIRSTIGF